MDYIYKSCPVCGSVNLNVTASHNIDGDTTHEYKCISCFEVFSSSSKREKFLRAQEAERRHRQEIADQKKQDEEARLKEIEEAARQKAILEAKAAESLSAKEIFKKTNLSLVELYCDFDGKATTGTGIIINDLYILSNAHVVFDPENHNSISDTIGARFAEEQEVYEVEFVYADKEKDISLLMFARDGVRGGEYNPVVLSKTPVETGDKIFALGNTKGQGIAILDGIISDDHRILNGNEYFMFSAPVTHGNSGGPVFNDHGELIGMVTLGNKDAVSMNYAIPVNVLLDFIHMVEEKEEIVVLD